ncbi:MAG: hypothetical protein ACR2JM_11725 [Mycobacterium sp.]
MTADALSGFLDAHGGLSRFRSLSTVELDLSVHGFLFTAKRITPLRHARMTIDLRQPFVALHDFPRSGRSAVLNGADRVEIRDDGGNVLSSRADPRSQFSHWRRSLYWDALDFAYFSGYAMWNYLSLPFLLRHPGVVVETIEGCADATVIEARFPAGFPTHSTVQRFHFDSAGLLRRHDYTADVVGRWAKAAHLCTDYREFGGLWMPTRRRVYPRGPLGRPLPLPTLVAIDIHDARPV